MGRRWPSRDPLLRLLLAIVTALAALLLPALHASASGLPAAQTRVGAISPTVTTVVGVAEHIAAGQRRSRAPSQLRHVVGHGVAAEGGGGSVFWSGIKGGDSAAASWAAKNGGTTLEMSLEQRGISLPAFDRAKGSW